MTKLKTKAAMTIQRVEGCHQANIVDGVVVLLPKLVVVVMASVSDSMKVVGVVVVDAAAAAGGYSGRSPPFGLMQNWLRLY